MSRHVAGHALHALEPVDELAVLAHLERCAECAGALRRHREVLGVLGGAAPDIAPPADLRERILRAAGGEPAPRSIREDHEVARPTRPRPSRVRSAGSGRRRLVAGLAAAAVAITVAGLAGQATDLAGQRDSAAAQARDLGRIVTGLDSPGSARATLTDGHGTPVAAVVAGPGSVQVVSVDLPTNDATHDVYVLWGLDAAGDPRAIGTFDVGPTGPEVEGFAAMPWMTGYAISVEPGRTPPRTPSQVVASGRVVL
ncbi:hypothetical protein TOK_1297 [Pseudonocardia sp. N23]|nr:hypothetical protein TOK_1297 [Pseudonocardia sp. N23]